VNGFVESRSKQSGNIRQAKIGDSTFQTQRASVKENSGQYAGFALVLGLFLGLALLKFGNPIILDSKVSTPDSFAEAISDSWPPHWSVWFLFPLALIGILVAIFKKRKWPGSRWLWILPVVWLAWEIISATRSVDAALTSLTLAHFGGCVACYFLGVWLLDDSRSLKFLLVGLLAAFAFCLVRAVNQKLFEFPQERQMLLEGERSGWTNYAPDLVLQMKADGLIVATNGADVANPAIMAKYEKGRVFGTLVYPNALAGAVILLLPITLTLAINGTRRFRKLTRAAAIALTLFLGLGSLFWTGSKSGWLIALAMLGLWLFRLKWSARLKWLTFSVAILVGVAAFIIRFHSYFVSGATSVGARFDYWRAAIQNTADHPLLGSGPGTFYRAYEKLKRPESEMARLTHNDYLQQFSDSGFLGGFAYTAWILLLLATLTKRLRFAPEPMHFALFLGLLGWFAQGFSEFSLYIPALAWTSLVLAGGLLKMTQMRSTRPDPAS
jgi:hypothetical protein